MTWRAEIQWHEDSRAPDGGSWDGPVDGVRTPALTEALKDFQTVLGVQPTGTVDAATVAALEKAIADGQAEPSATATTSAPPSPADTSTSSPPTTSPSSA
jgi:peptidoglycan hydrolase-like protein with peptidoglycan-binding domain